MSEDILRKRVARKLENIAAAAAAGTLFRDPDDCYPVLLAKGYWKADTVIAIHSGEFEAKDITATVRHFAWSIVESVKLYSIRNGN